MVFFWPKEIKDCSGWFGFLFLFHLPLYFLPLKPAPLTPAFLHSPQAPTAPLFLLSSLYCSVHARGLAPALQSWTFQPRLHPPLSPRVARTCPNTPTPTLRVAACAPQVCLCWIINPCDFWSGQLFPFHAQQCGKCFTDPPIFRLKSAWKTPHCLQFLVFVWKTC